MRANFLRRCASALIVLALLIAAANVAVGMFKMPDDVPVARLITNVSAYVKEHPLDAQGVYTLARLHSLAYTYRRDTVRVYQYENQLPRVDHQFHPRKDEHEKVAGQPLTDAQALEHLDAALKYFQQAIQMDNAKALYHNSYAYVLETAASPFNSVPPGLIALPASNDELAAMEKCLKDMRSDRAAERETGTKALIQYGAKALPVIEAQLKKPDAKLTAQIQIAIGALWTEQAIDEYLEAYRLAIGEDSKIQMKPMTGMNSLVSYEAGHKYIELTKSRGVRDAEKKNIDNITQSLAFLDKKPYGPVTPIIFSIDSARPLADLLSPNTRVHFDLDGTQSGAEWPWVKPDTAILVWDPRGTGAIMSGRQLFGSVTWWMFWQDGYHALDALDDNRDGQLSGEELRGLCVWRDANGNGVCDPGEVVPVEALGIESISVKATDFADGCPANAMGIRMRDGRVLPTYDWVTQPIKDK